MAKQKLRDIVVDGFSYRWSFTPAYMITDPIKRKYCCYDVFKAFAKENRTSPLAIVFITWECAISGGPLRTGQPVVWDDPGTGGINLHTPKWAATLIREGLKRGWQANALSTPFTVENGVELLAELDYKPD